MKLEVSAAKTGRILFNIFCFILTFAFAKTLNYAIGQIAVVLYILYFLFKYARKTLEIIDLLVLLPLVLLLGTNYLLWFGIPIIILCLIQRPRLIVKSIMDIEVVSFSVMCLCGALSSVLSARDTKSAHLYMGVYFMLLMLVVGCAMLRKVTRFREDYLIDVFSWISFVIGSGYFMTHTVSQLFNTAHIFIYYISDYGVYSNTLTGIMAPFAVGSILVLFETKRMLPRILSACSAIMIILVILAVQSRGTYLGLLFAVLWICKQKKASKVLSWGIVLAIILVFVSFFVPDAVWSSLFGRLNLSYVTTNGDFSNGRFVSYKKALDMYLLHPIIGCGFWQFDFYGVEYSDPHNFVLAYMASTGTVGFLGMFIYLVSIYRRLTRVYNENAGEMKVMAEITMCGFIIFVIHGLVEPTLTTSAPLSIFILLSACVDTRNRNGAIGGIIK